ncbi:sialic acid-binding Ig-like lectin 13 [Gastrophryne carolinensis]
MVPSTGGDDGVGTMHLSVRMRLCNGCHLLAKATIIVLLLICKGIRGQSSAGYSIDVTSYVSVQESQCVTIPCTFTFGNRKRFTNGRGFWMINSQNKVADSNEYDDKYGTSRANFRITGNPNQGNCTLTITDASKTDSGSYFFRFEKSEGFGYINNYVEVDVKDLTDKPEISQSCVLVAGHNVTLTCIPPGNCPGASPTIQWRKSDLDGVWGESSTLTFSPKPSDHQMNVTCEVNFLTAKTSVQKTLDVLCTLSHTNGTLIIYDDRPVTLNCSGDGNPPAKVIWSKGNGPNLAWSAITTNFSVEEIYTCVAFNDYGSIEEHLKIILGETIWSSDNKTAIINKGDSITCFVNSRFSVNVIWLRGDNVVMKSTNQKLDIQVNSAGTYRCLAWNSLGITTKSLKLVLSDKDRIFNLLIGMVCGMAIVIFFLLLFKLISRKRQKQKTKYNSMNEHPPAEDGTTEDPNQIYMNVCKSEKPLSEEDTKEDDVQEDTISLPKDQEELHYSTIVFQSPLSAVISKQPETEYAEIKINNLDQ